MKKNKGFTLVELLIVIIIIGILAAGMMMVMGSSTDKAAATRLVSDMRTLASNVVQYYADMPNAQGVSRVGLENYANKSLTGTVTIGGAAVAQYSVASRDIVASGVTEIWVGVAVNPATTGVQTKLTQIATNENITLHGGAVLGDGAANSIPAAVVPYVNQAAAYMRAR